MNNVIEFLITRLKIELPGWDLQKSMAPDRIRDLVDDNEIPNNARESAALVLIYQPTGARSASIILTLRSEQLNSHKGQISFPGGRLELGETCERAAQREALEEIGLEISKVHIIGRLSPIYIPPSNSLMTPILAICTETLNFNINDAEVQEILIIPLSQLEKNKIKVLPIDIEYDGSAEEIIAPQWQIHPRIPLWGATAMVLFELVSLIEEFFDGAYPLIDLFATKEETV